MLNDISTGASNDIQRASGIARDMVTKYGMSDELGPISFASDHDEVFLGRDFASKRNFSEDIAALIDREVKVIVEMCIRDSPWKHQCSNYFRKTWRRRASWHCRGAGSRQKHARSFKRTHFCNRSDCRGRIDGGNIK